MQILMVVNLLSIQDEPTDLSFPVSMCKVVEYMDKSMDLVITFLLMVPGPLFYNSIFHLSNVCRTVLVVARN